MFKSAILAILLLTSCSQQLNPSIPDPFKVSVGNAYLIDKLDESYEYNYSNDHISISSKNGYVVLTAVSPGDTELRYEAPDGSVIRRIHVQVR